MYVRLLTGNPIKSDAMRVDEFNEKIIEYKKSGRVKIYWTISTVKYKNAQKYITKYKTKKILEKELCILLLQGSEKLSGIYGFGVRSLGDLKITPRSGGDSVWIEAQFEMNKMSSLTDGPLVTNAEVRSFDDDSGYILKRPESGHPIEGERLVRFERFCNQKFGRSLFEICSIGENFDGLNEYDADKVNLDGPFSKEAGSESKPKNQLDIDRSQPFEGANVLKITPSANEGQKERDINREWVLLKEILNEKHLTETQCERLVAARIGQGQFRNDVLEIEPKCRVTGINVERYLRASHIKPWRYCDNEERLDKYNGLMLSPHVDLLFDSGMISFTADGNILLSDDKAGERAPRFEIVETCWKLDLFRNCGSFRPQQEVYLKWHREHFGPWLRISRSGKK